VLDAPTKHATRKTGFESLGLGEDLMAAVSEHRFEAPTEIQVIFWALRFNQSCFLEVPVSSHHSNHQIYEEKIG